MVQRKVVLNRLGIQGDHDKGTYKRLRNSKPELSQYQDCKNGGGHDLKKVLKKSRSVKLSDNEGSRLVPAVKLDKSLPGKPQPTTNTAPGNISAKAAAMQPKQSPVVKTLVGSPNYMKSTSSSNARMERATAIQTSSHDNKCSGQQKSTKTPTLKPNMKPLTRVPSLKLTRSLKKSPSFKHVRLVAKKDSKVGVSADKDVQRATCSSTLKDSKFPGYLMLNPGATESNGTSIWKVCTYKYCSLNGHFHTPLPPLKAFLSAKRRLLKTEKVMKLEALTQPANESKDRPNSSEEEDYLQIKDGGMEFFIEVHDGSCMNQDLENQEQIECSVKMEVFDDLMMISIGNLDDGRTEEYDEQDAESVSNRSPHFEIDYDDDHLDQQFDIVSTGINSSMFLHEESIEGGEDEEEKQPARGEMNEPDCDAFEMEWEEGQHIEPCSNKYEFDCAQLAESESPVKSKYKLDGGSSNCSEEIVADEVVQDELDLDLELEVSPVLEGKVDEPLAFSASEESTTTPIDELNSSENDSASTEGPGREANAFSDERNAGCIVKNEILRTIGPAPEDDCTNCSTVKSEEPYFVKDQEHVMETDAEVHVCREKVVVDNICKQTRFVEQQNDGSVEMNGVTEVEADESVVTTSFVLEQQIPNTGTEDAMEKIDNLDESESMSNMPTNDPTQDFLESALEYSVAADDNEAIQYCQDDANADEFELGHDDVDEASCSLLENHGDIEDLNHSEKENTEPEKSEYTYSADSDQLIGISTEDNGESEAAQICLNADTLPSENAGFYARANMNAEELLDACTNLRLTIGSKKILPDAAEERNFNPHEPNYLPLTPDPEAEKVDLRHQTEDERKNAEEWMLDYALRQTVTKLTPARSKRVALLVEAFETVKPKPKFDTNQRLTSATLTGVRPPQTCI